MKTSALKSSEYNSYYQTYINKLPDEELLKLLGDLKLEFAQFLKGLKEEDLKHSYSLGKWTVAE